MSDVQRWYGGDVQLGRMYEIVRKHVYLAPEMPTTEMALALNEIQRELNADHVAAVAEAEQAGRARAYAEHIGDCGNSAYLAGVQAARGAAAGLPAYYAIEECQGNPLEKGDPEDPDPWKQGHLIERDDTLAAIDALLKEKP